MNPIRLIINKLKKLTKKEDDNMKIEQIKKRLQPTTKYYLVGIKFITTETVESVMSSIKRDLNIYPNIYRFVIVDNFIEIGLETNATPTAYYCEDKVKFDEICEKLEELCNEENIILTKI